MAIQAILDARGSKIKVIAKIENQRVWIILTRFWITLTG